MLDPVRYLPPQLANELRWNTLTDDERAALHGDGLWKLERLLETAHAMGYEDGYRRGHSTGYEHGHHAAAKHAAADPAPPGCDGDWLSRCDHDRVVAALLWMAGGTAHITEKAVLQVGAAPTLSRTRNVDQDTYTLRLVDPTPPEEPVKFDV